MAKVKNPHPGHDKHLCYLANMHFQWTNPKDFKSLVRNPKFMCKLCGRAAASDKNLCKPVKL